MTRPTATRTVLAVVAVLLLGACTDPQTAQRQPSSPTDGLQATGQLDGSRIAISAGEPAVVVGDCDPENGPDDDVCIVARTIDGLTLNLVIENPAALVAGQTLRVGPDRCQNAACDDVTDHAVVDLRFRGQEVRAQSGQLDVTTADGRYAASFRLVFPGRTELTGDFDVAPPTAPPGPGGAQVTPAPPNFRPSLRS